METNNSSKIDLLQETGASSFEVAFARLETILEQMNTGALSLDESLKLYEEADKLISICNKRLSEAERRIEVLVKNRSGDLALGPDGKPLIEKM